MMLTFKVVIIGEKGVGKTSLVQRYTDDKFSENVDTTIGAQFNTKIVELGIPSKLFASNTSRNPSVVGK